VNFGCRASHLNSVPVHETFQGQTVWRGSVEVFEIQHPSGAKRAYGWAYADLEGDLQTAYMTILGVAPIHGAQDAVRAAICAVAKGEMRSPAAID